MTTNCQYEVHTLPDIEMYGGDTLPWEITLVKDNGSRFLVDTSDIDFYNCTLSFTPLKATSGLGNNVAPPSPILKKTGTFVTASDGMTSVLFDFEENDTKNLRGKFVYQVEVTHGDDDLRICQGSVYIKQNINR